MVERVARALYAVEANCEVDWSTFWWTVNSKKHYFGKARAVIEAMREPTEAMLAAGMEQLGAEDIWPDMIDAALLP